jgi:opacity protein-like surface antigen
MLSDINGGDAYEDGFQYGLGAAYNITENFSVFAAYVWLYDDTGFDYVAQRDDVDANVWTLGVSYKF